MDPQRFHSYVTPEPYDPTIVTKITIESEREEELEIESANYDLLMSIFPPPFPLNLRRISRQVSHETLTPMQFKDNFLIAFGTINYDNSIGFFQLTEPKYFVFFIIQWIGWMTSFSE